MSKPPASSRPDAETVKQLAESAKFQKRMWETFVPERGIRFGDAHFVLTVGGDARLCAWRVSEC